MGIHEIQIILSCVIFLLTYLFIVLEVMDRTVVALSGAALMILLKIISQENAFKEIDYNTLGLLIGMMIIVMIMKRTGIFEYLGIQFAKVAKGDPVKILLLLSLFTGISSAVLDNVTTILLTMPLTFGIAKDLRINPIPFVIAEVFSSNIGGTATLIGDPPNIMVGSAANLSFMDFIYNDAPIAIPMLFVFAYVFIWIYRKKLVTTEEAKGKIMRMDARLAIKDKVLLVKSTIVLAVTILGFMFHGVLHYESSTIAMSGGIILLLISKIKPEKILHEIEWSTIFFFIGLFILVGGIKETGVINWLAKEVLQLTQGNEALTAIAILWVAAIASAFIDNIPFVATMIPMIQDMGTMSGMNLMPLWWALSLGACLGGNGTLVGASANVVATGMAAERGHKISFMGYFKVAFPLMLVTIIIASVYLYMRYLL